MRNEVRRQREQDKLSQRQKLKETAIYRAIEKVSSYMDHYYLDAFIGFVPGWGDILALLSTVPFVYFSICKVKSAPLTLAIINNALRDVLLGMIPFFVGDIIDIFHRANAKNMQITKGFVEGDEAIIKEVNRRAVQSAFILIGLLVLIVLMVWLLFTAGNFVLSQLFSAI